MQSVVRLELQHFQAQTASHIINGMQVNAMNCSAIEHTETRNELRVSTLADRVRVWVYRTFVYSSRLDLDTMPDRVKRDLGFMDGREPRDQIEPWR
jgi:hypothetical protein